jgi:hypothetical protein
MLTLGYLGLDGLVRETKVEVRPTPAAITFNQMRVPILLGPGEQSLITIRVQCKSSDETIGFTSEPDAESQLANRGAEIGKVDIYTSNEQFNDSAWSALSIPCYRNRSPTCEFGV